MCTNVPSCPAGDLGSESKDLRVTGHRWRFGVYSGHSGSCLHMCVSRAQCHAWTASSLIQRSEQQLHRTQRESWPQKSYLTLSHGLSLCLFGGGKMTYLDLWVSRILTRPFIDLKWEKTNTSDLLSFIPNNRCFRKETTGSMLTWQCLWLGLTPLLSPGLSCW